MIDTALLGMAGAATGAVFTACGFVISCAVKVGRHLQVIDDLGKRTAASEERADVTDLKVERHLQWHEDNASEGNAE